MNCTISYLSTIKHVTILFLIPVIAIAVSCENPESSKSTGKSDSQSQLLPFSPVVRADGTIYISGQIAPGENKPIEVETREVMEKIGTILKESGCDFNDVVRCSVFLADINDYAAVNKVYASFFNGKYPSRVAMEVSRLVKGAQIEISAIAVKKESSASEVSKSKN